jgi:hypothetical protein
MSYKIKFPKCPICHREFGSNDWLEIHIKDCK